MRPERTHRRRLRLACIEGTGEGLVVAVAAAVVAAAAAAAA